MSKKPKKGVKALPETSGEPFGHADLLDVLEAATAFGTDDAILLLNRRADAIASRRVDEQATAHASAMAALDGRRQSLLKARAWAAGVLLTGIVATALFSVAHAHLAVQHTQERQETQASLAQGFFRLNERDQWPKSLGGARIVVIAPKSNAFNSVVGSTVVFDLGAKRAGDPLKVVYSRFDSDKAPVESTVIDLTDRSGTVSVPTEIGAQPYDWLRMEALR